MKKMVARRESRSAAAARSLASAALVLASVALGLSIPTLANAQNACSAALDTALLTGPNFGIVGSQYGYRIGLGAGTITGGAQNQLTVNQFRFELDCANNTFVNCPDEGPIIKWVSDSTIQVQGNCLDANGVGVSWSTGRADGSAFPNTVIFTPSSPVVFAANTPADPAINPTACQIFFDLEVNQSPGADASPLVVMQAVGLSQITPDGTCDQTPPLPAAGQGSTQINLCQACAASTEECDAGEVCNQVTGQCDVLPDPPLSTPCRNLDGDLCTAEHCDPSVGVGTCVPDPANDVVCAGITDVDCDAGEQCNPATGVCDALPDPPLSTPCRDLDGNLCTAEHCDPSVGAGTCVPDPPNDVVCAGSSEECDAGEICNPGTGLCDVLPDPPLSTPCRNLDGDLCTAEHCDPSVGVGTCVPDPANDVVCAGSTEECDAGELCNPGTGLCDVLPDPPLSTPCRNLDGNLCTAEHCDPSVGVGTCVPDPANDVVCPPGACFTETCTPATGLCGNRVCNPASNPAECQIIIGDCIWEDTDEDGIQDAGEMGISGVDVSLLDCSGPSVALATVATDGVATTGVCAGDKGGYQFTIDAVDADCEPADQMLKLSVDTNTLPLDIDGVTLMDVGDDNFDNDCDASAMSVCMVQTAGSNNPSLDCGFKPVPPSIPASNPGWLALTAVLLLASLGALGRWRVARGR